VPLSHDPPHNAMRERSAATGLNAELVHGAELRIEAVAHALTEIAMKTPPSRDSVPLQRLIVLADVAGQMLADAQQDI
jgi:hypothetical protein